jgi:hypothetical protein
MYISKFYFKQFESLVASVICALVLTSSTASASETPKEWEQLFFHFPIVGAPPQLEQQAQFFESYFHGNQGGANILSAELAYIATPHFGLVLNIPFQIGSKNLTTGFVDFSLLLQYLVAGSLKYDNMLSVGLFTSFPTGRADLSQGDFFVGPFAYAAQRLWHRVIFEGNLTTLLPVVHGESARLIVAAGLFSVLVTPLDFGFPIYAQMESDCTTFLGGTAALPPGAKRTPVTTIFVAPELFFGPFASPISDGTRAAVGVFVNLTGDREHNLIYTITIAIDIPNPYGY